MRKRIKNDRRIQKTLEKILSAFKSLVEKSSYEELTVTAICREAHIGRKTFYQYYSSLDDLFAVCLEKLAQGYAQRIAGLKVPENIAEITREFYQYSLEQGEFYEKLICNSSYEAQGAGLFKKFVRSTWHNEPWFIELGNDSQEILLAFIYNSSLGIYRQWVHGGKKIALERIIFFADVFLSDGARGFHKIVQSSRV